MGGLYPDTLYYIWLAARSQRGEGATTAPIPVRTKQYGKILKSWFFFSIKFPLVYRTDRVWVVMVVSRIFFLSYFIVFFS